MEQNIIVSNAGKLEVTKNAMRGVGAKNLHILADFDRTLTKAYVNGKSTQSLISILRDHNYLTPDYADKAHALFDKYHPIELDHTVPREERKSAMEEWWRAHFKLLIDSGLEKKDIEQAVTSGKVMLRNGVVEFVEFLHAHDIPLVIMSSSGLGTESVAQYLKHAGILYDNVHIICNEYEWDERGKAIGIREPIIHALNKYETVVKDYPAFASVKDRKNVILLGDGLDDIGMVEGFPYEHLITIGFFNDKTEERLKEYKRVFDVVLTGDASFDQVNKLVQEIA